jgi:hypothetical protein
LKAPECCPVNNKHVAQDFSNLGSIDVLGRGTATLFLADRLPSWAAPTRAPENFLGLRRVNGQAEDGVGILGMCIQVFN